MSRQELEASVIAFLRQLCARRQLIVTIGPDTPLFETKILDSIQFLELMSFLETECEIEVPDRMLSMEFFESPRVIAGNFGAAVGS
jgi:acyl carrier protein